MCPINFLSAKILVILRMMDNKFHCVSIHPIFGALGWCGGHVNATAPGPVVPSPQPVNALFINTRSNLWTQCRPCLLVAWGTWVIHVDGDSTRCLRRTSSKKAIGLRRNPEGESRNESARPVESAKPSRFSFLAAPTRTVLQLFKSINLVFGRAVGMK